MKIQHLVVGLALVTSLAVPIRVAAQTETVAHPDTDRSGWFVGAGFAFAFAEENFGFGGGLWFGYRLNPHFALEGQFEYLSGYTWPLALEGYKATLNAKAYLATGRLQPFFVAGGGGGTAQFVGYYIGSGFIGRVGGGFDFWATESFAIVTTLDYTIGTGSVAGFDHASIAVGGQWRF